MPTPETPVNNAEGGPDGQGRSAADGAEAGGGAPPPLKDDGLPTLPTGEPVLQRWFVVTMLVMVPVAVAVTVWALLSIDRDPLSAAERRPAGGAEVTIARGDAMLSETRDAVPGPGCAQAIRIVGDTGSQAAAAGALAAACEVVDEDRHPELREGLVAWIAGGGQLRVATFELSGVESSTRLEDGRLVMELNAKFQFEAAVRAAPAVLHQLVLLSDPAWPGAPVGVTTELAAARIQQEACRTLDLGEDLPRGCRDVDELLAADDPVAELLEVGFRDDR